VSDYGLDDRAIEVRSPAGAKNFSFNLCVQTGSGAHPASCTVGTEGPFPEVKRGRGVTLTTHSYLVSRMSRSYIHFSPQAPPWRVAGLLCSTFAVRLLLGREFICWYLKSNDAVLFCMSLLSKRMQHVPPKCRQPPIKLFEVTTRRSLNRKVHSRKKIHLKY
jgi:hypothetical protein